MMALWRMVVGTGALVRMGHHCQDVSTADAAAWTLAHHRGHFLTCTLSSTSWLGLSIYSTRMPRQSALLPSDQHNWLLAHHCQAHRASRYRFHFKRDEQSKILL
jgi:hypothetical protein